MEEVEDLGVGEGCGEQGGEREDGDTGVQGGERDEGDAGV